MIKINKKIKNKFLQENFDQKTENIFYLYDYKYIS
jgi:hypothetical protein